MPRWVPPRAHTQGGCSVNSMDAMDSMVSMAQMIRSASGEPRGSNRSHRRLFRAKRRGGVRIIFGGLPEGRALLDWQTHLSRGGSNMSERTNRTSRRTIIKAGAVGAAALGGVAAFGTGCKKQRKTLRIVQWNHFVPAYDKWFKGTYVKQWGEQNDTDVIVDNVGIPALNPAAAAE